MRNIRSSVLLKAIAFVLQQIFFIIMVLSVFIGVTYWNRDDASFDLVEQKDFTKTNYYKRLVEDNIYNLITYIEFCEKFQTNGSNQMNRIVDVYDYVQNNRITGETTISFGYSIQELLDWKEAGFHYVSNPDAMLGVPAGENVPEYYLTEAYSNTLGITIPAYCQMKEQNCQEVYQMIEAAADKLDTEYAEYKNQVSQFKENNTNLRYAVLNADRQIFHTNMSVSYISEGINKIRDLGSFVILDSATADFNSNIFYSDDRLNHYLNTLYMDNKNYILAVGVDTAFPVLDQFHKEKLRYSNYERWFQVLYKLLVISIIGYIACFFYLSVSVGHKKGCADTTLTVLEKLKTELLAAVFFCGEFYCIGVLRKMIHASPEPVLFVQLTILMTAASLLLGICYLSFLRRIKAGILWTNSYLCRIIEFVHHSCRNIHSILYIVIICLLLVAADLVYLYISCSLDVFLLLFLAVVVIGYILICNKLEMKILMDGSKNIADGDLKFQIDTERLHREYKLLGEEINQISLVLHEAVEDSVKSERLKTDLITNVSHDIKTPMTSIINYVSLLKEIPLENPDAQRYVQILDEKSQRLRQLTEDLVEASKIRSKNIHLDKAELNLVELMKQIAGEFHEKFRQRRLTLVLQLPPEPVMIEADAGRLLRILENLYNNAFKYSLENSRIYAKVERQEEGAVFSLKNISEKPLAVDGEELTKRFVRGDVSRSSEGSGLGLSIAKDLMELHGGSLQIQTDGDLFTVVLHFLPNIF